MKRVYKVEGMSCVNCARTIQIALSRKEGIKDVEVSFELGRVRVEFDEERISEEEIKRAIEELGYRVVEEEQDKLELITFALSAFSSLTIASLMFLEVKGGIYIQLLLSTLVQVIGGWKFYKGAYNSLKNRVAGMDVLVALGTTGSYLYSLLVFLELIPGKPFFETNAFLITFVRGGRLIEETAKRKSLRLLKTLLSSQYIEVSVVKDGTEERKNAREVLPGEILLLRPGDMIPVDGIVVKGEGYVSEAVVSGEPKPILRKKGDRIVGGSLVEAGTLYVEAKSSYESSYLGKISRLIEKALTDKPRIQRLADRVSHYFVQFVVLVAVVTFVFWFYVTGDLQKAVQFSLAVLVISCPCALGIATPLAVAVGLTKALSSGIIIKRPSSIEEFSHIDLVVFDKTGTVTEGTFKVVDFRSNYQKALDIALTLENVSNHPIARAIREFAISKGARELQLVGCREVLGRGVECGEYFIGGYAEEGDGTKVIALQKGDTLLALFYLKDSTRAEAGRVVSELKKMGLKTLLLSGDGEEVTKKVCEELHFDGYIAQVKPEEKKRIIEELQTRGHRVAMVGDGINDAPALAQANLSFAISQGTEITKQVGDVLLLRGISAIPDAFRLGKKVNTKIKQNLGWAFVYNLLGIPLASGVFYSYGLYLKPEIAGLMMALSSISVVINTLLLNRVKLG